MTRPTLRIRCFLASRSPALPVIAADYKGRGAGHPVEAQRHPATAPMPPATDPNRLARR
jgi:hypothetical protein